MVRGRKSMQRQRWQAWSRHLQVPTPMHAGVILLRGWTMSLCAEVIAFCFLVLRLARFLVVLFWLRRIIRGSAHAEVLHGEAVLSLAQCKPPGYGALEQRRWRQTRTSSWPHETRCSACVRADLLLLESETFCYRIFSRSVRMMTPPLFAADRDTSTARSRTTRQDDENNNNVQPCRFMLN